MPERLVFDTNIWISGLLWRGKPYQCLLLARGGAVQHIHCDEMLVELSRKLREKFGFSEDRVQAVVSDLSHISERVEITGNIRSQRTRTTTSSLSAHWSVMPWLSCLAIVIFFS